MYCRRTVACLVFAAVMIAACAVCSGDGTDVPGLEDVTALGEHSFSCMYSGTERRFEEYAPDGEVRGIILMLHGYGSDGKAFRNDIKIDVPANERGYSVIYVNGLRNPEDAASATGWNSGIGSSPVDDVGFLKALAFFFQAKYGLTRAATFAAGFSNGGFMMYRLATEARDMFAGVAAVAGMMPKAVWNERADRTDVSILQINGTKDDAVPMNMNGTAKYTGTPAIEDVIDYFASADGLTKEETEDISERAVLTKHSAEGKKEQVWQVLVKDGRHSWPEEKYVGFDTNQLILDFCEAISE